MSENVLLEENGFFAWVWVLPLEDGKYNAYVTFERKADHQNIFVPAARHKLLAEFDTPEEAVSEASLWAIERMKKNETMIDRIHVVRNG